MSMITCPGCEKSIHITAAVCPNCGAPNMQNTQAVGASNPPQLQSPPGKGMGIASMVLGIVSLVVPCINLITAPIALILGIISRKKLKAVGHPTGKATAGIVMGIIAFVLSVIMFVMIFLSPIAIPALLANRSIARDKVSMANALNIHMDFIMAIDDAKEKNIDCKTPAAIQANIIGNSAATSRISMLFTGKNPWKSPGFPDAYNRTLIIETDDTGTKTRAAATSATKGQVQIGYKPARNKNDSAFIFTAVYLRSSPDGVYFKSSVID